jgi:hypothetical protein
MPPDDTISRPPLSTASDSATPPDEMSELNLGLHCLDFVGDIPRDEVVGVVLAHNRPQHASGPRWPVREKPGVATTRAWRKRYFRRP